MENSLREKPSTKILRIVASVRDSIDQIEHGKPASYHEIKRLEQLDRAFSTSLFNALELEQEQWKTYQSLTDFLPKFLKTLKEIEINL